MMLEPYLSHLHGFMEKSLMICLNTEVKSLRFKANKADTLEISLLFKWVQEANIRWLSQEAST